VDRELAQLHILDHSLTEGCHRSTPFARDELQIQRPNRLAKGLNGEFRVRYRRERVRGHGIVETHTRAPYREAVSFNPLGVELAI
jgi:hypothetical protein